MNAKKKRFIDALVENHGIVTDACRKAGICRATYYKWREQDAELAELADDAQEAALDYVEGKLYTQIENGDTTAIIFYLKTRGRARGYNERLDQRITMANDECRATWDDVVATITASINELPEQTK